MSSLKSIVPEFAIEVEAALVERGRSDIVPQLGSAQVERCMYDEAASGGYICLSRSRPIPNLVRPVDEVAQTLFFLRERGFSIDLDREGRILGIELLGRADIVQQMQAGNAL